MEKCLDHPSSFATIVHLDGMICAAMRGWGYVKEGRQIMPQQLRAYLMDRNEEIREDVEYFSGPRYRADSDQSLHWPQQLVHIHMCSRFSKIIPTRLLEHSLRAKGQKYSPNKEYGATLVGGPPPPPTNRGCLLLLPPPARTSPPLFGRGVSVVAG